MLLSLSIIYKQNEAFLQRAFVLAQVICIFHLPRVDAIRLYFTSGQRAAGTRLQLAHALRQMTNTLHGQRYALMSSRYILSSHSVCQILIRATHKRCVDDSSRARIVYHCRIDSTKPFMHLLLTKIHS